MKEVVDIWKKKSIEKMDFILNDLNINASQLAKEMGYKRPERLYKVIRGENSISKKLAEEINERFPQYSVEWLLSGDISNVISGVNNVINNGGTNSVVMGDSNVYSSPNDEIQALRKENEYLKQIVEQQKETITLYKQLNNK